MDLNALKRQLIDRILRTDDRELLLTVQRMLQLEEHPTPPPGNRPFLPDAGTTDADTEELQREIDELLGDR